MIFHFGETDGVFEGVLPDGTITNSEDEYYDRMAMELGFVWPTMEAANDNN